MLNLSRGEIIQEGLSQAGRPDLLAEARLWLNLFLDKIYQNQDYHWLIKDNVELTATQGGTLPIDYRAAVSATFGPQGNVAPLEIIWDLAEFDTRKNLLVSNSVTAPNFVFIDHVTNTFQFLPPPEGGSVWHLSYYHIPSLPDHKDSDTDGLVPYWKAPSQILVDAIYSKALQYNDDERQGQADQTLQGDIVINKQNNHDRRAGRSKIKLGKSFRNRFDRFS